MKKGVLVGMLFVMLAGMATAQQTATTDEMGVTVDLTWVSKYIWRGLDLGDNKAAFQPSVDFDLWGSGFSAKIWGTWLGGPTNGAETLNPTEKLEYSLTYVNRINEGDAWQTDYAVTYTYADYYTTSSSDFDYQDLAASFAWPMVLGNGWVPHYTLAYSWSGRPGPTTGWLTTGAEGFVHMPGLDYNFNAYELPMIFSMNAVFNDGTYSQAVDHDWAAIVWGLSTSFQCPFTGAKITPAIYYQTSMDDSVNENDEFWTGLSYTMKF
ncbi:MAG: hypothetical protein JW828_15605 [Sedimentisphaerales bacterium]|nr:hypothetical protein [Sedimentisphaerales bacterium]